MEAAQLEYENLKKLIQPFPKTGWTESASFLYWFLLNVHRMEETAAQDAVCDTFNDKGVDAIVVDHDAANVRIYQAKIRQNPGATLGDNDLKTFWASAQQFSKPENIDQILSGSANAELKRILTSNDIRKLISDGYTVRSIFVTNSIKDHNSDEYLRTNNSIEVFDRHSIIDSYIDYDKGEYIKGDFVFDVSYIEPVQFSVGQSGGFIAALSASDLVKMGGIADGSLFAKNVRYSLGNTPVNREISKSLSDSTQHSNFLLYHNGIIIICDMVSFSEDKSKLIVKDYMVVNGAQSLTTFFHNSDKITKDLRVFAKIISTSDRALVLEITKNSNNQNAIKPRDLRSNHHIQQRLAQEFETLDFENYVFEIKRGQTFVAGANVISNEEAGRLLLAFDVEEPWSCHQIYKVFDERYAEIFGRDRVTAPRIIFLFKIMEIIKVALVKIEQPHFASYSLTRYFVLLLVKKVLESDEVGKLIVDEPSDVLKKDMNRFLSALDTIIRGIMVDLNYKYKDAWVDFDYKSEMKSPVKVKELSDHLMKEYHKDLERQKAYTIGAAMAAV